MIEENIVVAPPDKALPRIKNKMNGYWSAANRLYIGATSNKEVRWAKHQRQGWRRMVILYDAYTPEIAAKMERALIDYARSCNFIVRSENIGPGGEGIVEEARSNFIYLLLA